jgi:hypothetical protein
MSIVLVGSTSGSITLQEPAVAGTTVLDLPATSGTLMVNGPAFSAYATSGQTGASGLVKVLFGTEEYDTNSNFASSRFTPTVAGYYQLNTFVTGNWVNSEVAIYVYKNGSNHKNGLDILIPTGGLNYGVGMSTLVSANGTTDYFEIYLYSGVSQTLGGTSTGTYFNGSMVRGA